MTLNANNAGQLSGKLTIPANVPAGSKRVEFVGSGGSRGEAIFTGNGEIVTNLRQLVTMVTTRWYDPLAQTFSLPENCQIGGVDLWFTAKGSTDVLVQLRETTQGVPNQTILGEARVKPASIVTTGGNTRVAFPYPIAVNAGQEYALVVICDDAVTSLAVAELGKWDTASGRWVTAQPYQVGVLLSSSNASTWTAHQDRDLAFRILKATFTETQKTVQLGNVTVTDATDLMLLAFAERPASSTAVVYELTLPDGEKIAVSDGQPVRLPASVTGNVGVAAKLSGSSGASPVLHAGAQLVSGHVATDDDYVSRAIPAGSNSRVRVIFDAIIPAGSAVSVALSGIDIVDSDQNVPYLASKNLDDGFTEITHELNNVSETMVRIKLHISGTSAARPRLRNLRVMVL